MVKITWAGLECRGREENVENIYPWNVVSPSAHLVSMLVPPDPETLLHLSQVSF